MTFFPKVGDKLVYFVDGAREYIVCQYKETIKVSTGEDIVVVNGKYPTTNLRPAIQSEKDKFFPTKKCNCKKKVQEVKLVPRELILRPKQITEIKEKL